ncbi:MULTISPECIES: GyrI-like domain-containing protein [unclassified Winogradskyella]|uniref:GyrI-like domain-containing protein n=1 Tax=unclassified Winogradskyella TaxID=2615021 RepID=UPI0012FBAC58|nr:MULTISPECIES: GyrI-like domain-containing protein [unclassified Winogradskyella]
MMKYRVVDSEEILVVGLKAKANFQNISQVTRQLAKQFMPRLDEVINRKNTFTLSLQNYNRFNFKNFNPNEMFEKWIGVEVNSLDEVPENMETLTITSGRYLVIDFKGSIPDFIEFWQKIHSSWLPSSDFELDNRPHFERLPPSYSPTQNVNEEEIWIPIL